MKKVVILLLAMTVVSLNGQGSVDRCEHGIYLSHAHALKSIKTKYPEFYKAFEKEVPFMIQGCQNGRHGLSQAAQARLQKIYA